MMRTTAGLLTIAFCLGMGSLVSAQQSIESAPNNYLMMLAEDDLSSAAQFQLGLRYLKGYGVSQDYAEAARWFRMAAMGDIPEAQHNLAVMLFKGEGVPKDTPDAIAWWNDSWRAITPKDGLAEAQFMVGSLYAQGLGVEQDDAMAAQWFELAANRGHNDAQYNLGILYSLGRGVPQNGIDALVWFDRAAAGGNEKATQNAEFIRNLRDEGGDINAIFE